MLVVGGVLEDLGGGRHEVHCREDGPGQESQVLLEQVSLGQLPDVEHISQGRVQKQPLVHHPDVGLILGQQQVHELLRRLILDQGLGRQLVLHALAHRDGENRFVRDRVQKSQEQVHELRVFFQNRQKILGEKRLDDGLFGPQTDAVEEPAKQDDPVLGDGGVVFLLLEFLEHLFEEVESIVGGDAAG